jgi:hypothetical protein
MPRTINCGTPGAKGLSVVVMAKLFTSAEGVCMEDADGNKYLTPWTNVLIAHLADNGNTVTSTAVDVDEILARKLASGPDNKRLKAAKEGNI